MFAGGGSKGALWSQILSDVTGLPVRVPVVREATALGCAIAAGTGAGLYGDMASTGERLVSWHREFTPNPQHRELYQEMMSKWQTVYADQLGLVDSGLTTSMWQAPGLERRQRVASSPHLTTGAAPPFPSPFGRGPGGATLRRSLNPITITALPFSFFSTMAKLVTHPTT